MSVELVALLIALVVGVSVFWSNPRRTINQAFAAASLFVTCWLSLLWLITSYSREDPVPWIKATSAVGAFFPWILWWLAHCIIYPECRWQEVFTRGKYWFACACILAAIATTDWFIPTESTRITRLWGPGAIVYNLGLLFCYLSLVVLGIRETRRQGGIQLVEIKIFLIGGAICCLVGLGLTMLPPMLGMRGVRGFAPLAVLFFYALTAWGITSRRIFDAKQLFASVSQRVAIISLASLLLSFWLDYTAEVLPGGVAMVLGVFACVSLVIYVEQRTKDSVFTGRARAAQSVRAAVLAAGRDETDPDALTERYCGILRQWGRTSQVGIRILGHGDGENLLPPESPGMELLHWELWATPESLARRRVTPGVEDVDRFMAQQKLGALVLSPHARGTAPLVIAMGQRDDRMPFLWPDIQNLLEWSELMEVAISRAYLIRRARETEQVATAGLLGASLAHEIRNPLVALKTFAQLLPERHEDPEFRDEFSKLLQKEVGRIESLTEQLLKLSTPRQPIMRPVRVGEIILECAALLKPRYAEGRTQLILDLAPNERPIQADSGSVTQVIINLLVNALQALVDRAEDRRVVVRTAISPREITVDIADNGPGVSPQQRAKLFQPFSSGKVSGFGLGLALSANIMRLHKGSIALLETGQSGATFRLTFPCPPS